MRLEKRPNVSTMEVEVDPSLLLTASLQSKERNSVHRVSVSACNARYPKSYLSRTHLAVE